MIKQKSLIGTRILFIDDTPKDITTISDLFTDLEATTIVAENSEEALKQLLSNRDSIDIVIVDVENPKIDAVHFTKEVRANERWNSLPIIFLTSNDDESSGIFQVLEIGGNDYLTKPVNQIELVARCLSMLRQKKLQDDNLNLHQMLKLEVVERQVELEQTKDAALFGFAKLAETRDPDAKTHLDTIREICMTLSQKAKESGLFGDDLDGKFIMDIFKASPLHDIGKVAIPDSILLKPGKLEKDEFTVMQRHADIGAKTLEEASLHLDNASFLGMACDIAMCHHEKWDGSGYPRGLKGNDIPLAARIMAIADVYDALSSKRVYKSATPHEEVLEIIKESSGQHFDPALVKIFIDNQQSFETIKVRVRERLEKR